MKRIDVPFIKGLENMGFNEAAPEIEAKGVEVAIDNVNWPEAFPYCPDCKCRIARGESHLYFVYSVKGLDLRAQSLEDNGRIWEDSCCEFFCHDPFGENYYNFEINCIGKLLGGVGPVREGRSRIDETKRAAILRFTTLESKAYDVADQEFSWKVGMGIPFELMGFTSENIPEKLLCNLYKCGDKTAHPHFLSWNPVQTPKPDFHRPDFFGEMYFEK